MPIRRVFLGWRQALLPGAVEHLACLSRHDGVWDLASQLLIVPGGRSGRRLLELLVERAERDGLPLIPPEITTLAGLGERLARSETPRAGDLLRRLAWERALHRLPRPVVQTLAPDAAGHDDPDRFAALAGVLDQMQTELAGEELEFADVVRRCRGWSGFRDRDRWQALAQAEAEYHKTLSGVGYVDPQRARLAALQAGAVACEKPITLIGVADANRLQRRLLDAVADRVTVLIHAPEALAERFDEHGCAVIAAWLHADAHVPDERIRVAERPADQAAAVTSILAGWNARFAVDDVTLGVPDETLVPQLEQQLARCGVPTRFAGGWPLARTAPFRLLEAAAELVRSRQFSDLAAFLRHPDVERWVRAAAERDGQGALPADFLSAVDQYLADHMQVRISSRWIGESAACATTRRAARLVDTLLSEFWPPVAGDHAGDGLDADGPDRAPLPRPLADWSAPIVRLLVSVVGHDLLNRGDPGDRLAIEACVALRGALQEQAALPVELMPTLGAAEAMELLLREARGIRIPPPQGSAAIEMLGWLELAADDAPALIVTSANEGFLPTSVNADPFLPNALRRRLGLLDNDHRLARDAYLLSVLLHSRPETWFVVGRRTRDGSPLSPSRLLLRTPRQELPARVRRLFSPGESSLGPAAGKLIAAGSRTRFLPPRPVPAAPPASLRVTAFRDYLACPYRFYLRHILKLAPLGDPGEELDAAAFGTLLHDVLQGFGESDLKCAVESEPIREYLHAELDRLAAAWFGGDPLPAVRIQLARIRRRLGDFAVWQADWAKKGWQIEHTEYAIDPERAALDVDGQPMPLRGRIDRIDVLPASGMRIVFDYKTMERHAKPEARHLRSGEWIDLQLPLYAHLLRASGVGGVLNVGYIVLGRDAHESGEALAGWGEAELHSAVDRARDVVRRIRRGDFWPPVQPPPPFWEEFADLCLDGQRVSWEDAP